MACHPVEAPVDMDEVITVIKINIQDQQGYLMIGWQSNSFEMYLYIKDKLWKGKFSSNRLAGFSKNLQITEKDYYKSLRNCLSREQNDYCYELNSGFFYWKRKLKNSVIIEGFLPIDIDTSAKSTQPDLVEVLIFLNKQLRTKAQILHKSFKSIKSEYQKCLKDIEEFLYLKNEMDQALSEKFLNLLHLQKTKFENSEAPSIKYNEVEHPTK